MRDLQSVFHLRFRKVESFDYVLKDGDTFWGIASSFRVDIRDLEATNKFEEFLLLPGQKIVVPQRGAGENHYFEEYEIEIGENLRTIARISNVEPALLLKCNDCRKLKLLGNQVLRIPGRRLYEIKEGDTLESILRDNNISYERFIETNIKNWIRPGNKVIIE